MTYFVSPHIVFECAPHITIPDVAQFGQKEPRSQANPLFAEPVTITQQRQLFVGGPLGSRTSFLTAVFGQGEDGSETYIYTGCFGGTLEVFRTEVVKRYDVSSRGGPPSRWGPPYLALYSLIERLAADYIAEERWVVVG